MEKNVLFNPNRSLGRLSYPFSLFKVCLCHISISLCSMTLLGLGRASELSLHSKITLLPFGRDVICVTFGILSTSLSRRSIVLRFAIETIHWMLSSHLNFVDVAMARQSKRAFSALENNVAPIRSRRHFSQRSPVMRPICSKQILICHKL